ncbi:MAG: hypothetical protein JO257_10510 [Deltaproteobacteria bacterium]|nr:hypothetical protein [Deltaproteobacteria bacterium]
MGQPPCTLLEVEMALDLLEGELAAELPAHMRAFARAHAEGRPPPPAPLLARLPSSLKTARQALAFDLVADRGIALLRLLVPLALEVGRTPPERTWDAYRTLAAARDQAARARFGHGAIELAAILHVGHVAEASEPRAIPFVDGWRVPDAAVDDEAIRDVWHLIASRLGVAGTVRIDRGAPGVTPRTFVVEPKAEAIVVLPAVIDTPRARTQVLHELGHAAAALLLPAGLPRAVDEAAAAFVARLAEPGSWLPPRWISELAPAARERRLAIAELLAAIERGYDGPLRPGTPPAALWEDPGAQSSYIAAEAIADRLAGQPLRHALATEADRVTWRACELLR